MTTLILVRHGQSTGNLQGLYCGQLDFPLSDKGFQQAELTGAYLKKNYQIDSIYSSDLCRAMQTAEPTAKAFGLEIIPQRDLREICVGEWEGQNADEVIQRCAEEYEYWKNNWDYAPKGGESHRQMQERVIRCLKKILSENDGKTAAVFAHVGTIAKIFHWCIPDAEVRSALLPADGIRNASVTLVRIEDGQFVDCVMMGYSTHLNELSTVTNPDAV